MFGGPVKGGKVLGHYPSEFEEGDQDGIILSRGRIIPTTPWDAMWKGKHTTCPIYDEILYTLNALSYRIVFNTEQNYIFNSSGVAEWFGIPEGAEGMDKVLPMHKNFPADALYGKDDLFDLLGSGGEEDTS